MSKIIKKKVKSKERQSQILAYLRAMQRDVLNDELSKIFNVSSVTIRRDLQELESIKAIIRTHGGCLYAGRISMETEYHKKVSLHFDQKQAIGMRASKEVNSGEVILVDDGSTTFHLASYLGHIDSLKIYTNSLALISEMPRFPGVTLSILGGVVDIDRFSVTGFLTEQVIEQVRFDKVFLGVDAIGPEGKCYVGSENVARLAQVMLRSGKKIILVSDHSKVGKEASFSYGTLEDFDKWITTPGMDPERMEVYKKMTQLIIV